MFEAIAIIIIGLVVIRASIYSFHGAWVGMIIVIFGALMLAREILKYLNSLAVTS